ncbi:MAG: adaptor protein MecA [Tyzzerella sp.]|uniref:Adaptor protein MecA n=1 Tax=Candidatus Fimicola merdigallinarum TaxID=2840819 RepID=A0A9D9DZ94_9FIRM|nr:adaptor protein MecA [Candidatus Fimicola merdigallinarum]
MKIEKISENQIKFTLTKSDLTERDIRIEDLTKTNEKTNALFKEIMEQAMKEYGFHTKDAPLMVEAVPAAMDGIMIIVTKLQDDKNNKKDTKLNMIKQSKELNRFKRKSLDTFEKESKPDDSTILIYSFKNIDDVTNACERVQDIFNGISSLYKYDDKYFLIIQNDASKSPSDLSDIELMVSEYGEKHISTSISKYFLMEHGEKLIENKAVSLLSTSFV